MKMVRKSCLLVLLLLAVGASAQERTYIISPSNHVVETATADEEFLKYYIYQENTTNKDLVLGWSRVQADIPSGWDYSLCDLGTCYPGIPEGQHTMAAAPAGEKAFLAMNIYLYGVSGTANIKMLVWDVNNPSIVDTVSWLITVTPTAGVEAPVKALPITVYPNPSTNRLVVHVEGNHSGTLQIFNSLGVEALSLPTNESSDVELDVSAFATGAYTVLFTAQDGTVSRTAFIKQ